MALTAKQAQQILEEKAQQMHDAAHDGINEMSTVARQCRQFIEEEVRKRQNPDDLLNNL